MSARGAKARPLTSLAHAAGTVLYPVHAERAAMSMMPTSERGVKTDGVDRLGYSDDWADGRTRRNKGGRWIKEAKARTRPSE